MDVYRSRSVETSSVPNGNETFSNLLRKRKCFTTSHMHIYSIPPMSRMNCRQKIVPKLLCSDFIRIFSLMVETTFWKRQPVIKLSELRFKLSNRRKIDVNNFELGQSTRGWRMVRVLQFAVVIQAGECFGRLRKRIFRLLYMIFQSLFHKIHDSYHNFFILHAKQSICSSLLD